jgi:hypothetical protein
MSEQIDILLYKLRFIIVGLLIFASLFLLSLLVSSIITPQAATSSGDTLTASMYDSPNAVTGGLTVMAGELGKTADAFLLATTSAGKIIKNGFLSAGSATVHGGKFIVVGLHNGVMFVAGSVGKGFMVLAHAVGRGIGFLAHTTGNVFGFVSNTPVVRAVLKPADSTRLPTIDRHAPITVAAHAAAMPVLETASQTTPAPQNDTDAVWPIHGAITTQYGVPHWPYQPTHTGIDISDGQPSGVTPVKPYKPGYVTEAVRSGSGLGNHVVVDHGGGITTVYGHLASLAVTVGQAVDKNTTLGYEGSTGASTGTHLHFEVRVKGQPVNPQQYVNGQP